MKRYGKRLLALLLVFALSAGTAVAAWAAAPDPEAEGVYDGAELSGSLGSMLASELEGGTAASQEGAYNITELTVGGSTAAVTYQAPGDASLIVAIYEEATGQMLATGMAEVDSTAETAVVPITGSVPEYFAAKAFLLDRDTLAPLGSVYRTDLYTAGMQTLLRQTVDDFDPALVLDLDGDRTTNFVVYRKDTVRVEDSPAVVTDNGDSTYTVTNADKTFTKLRRGDKLAYTDGEGTLWLIKVAGVAADGDTVTITGDANAALEDFFSTLKIEATEQDAEVTLEGYEPPKDAAENVSSRTSGTGVTLLSAGLETDEKSEKKYTLEFSTDKEQAIVVFGSVELTISIKYYYSDELNVDTTEIKITPKVSFGVKSKESGGAATTDYMIYRDLSLADWMQLDFFGGILTVGLEPKLELKVEGKVEATLSFSGTIGVKRSGDEKPQSLSTAPTAKFECKDEATIYAGLSLAPFVDIVDKKVMRISFKGALGVEAKVTLSQEFDKTEKTSIHGCELCLDGKVSTKGDVTVELKLLDGIGSASYSLLKAEREYARFYYSIDHSEFGSGKCPYIRYLLELQVVNEKGEPLPGAAVTGLGDTVLTTDLEGKAQIFVYKGEYSLTAVSSNEKHTGTKTVTVKDESVSATITARSTARAVTVTVVDQERKPLSGMTISGAGFDASPVTDKDGVAELELEDGNYTLTASNGTYSGAGTVSVRGNATRLTIIASDKPQDVTITAVTVDGERVPNLTIGGTGLDAALVTNENGTASFQLPWGAYDLTASGGAYSGSTSLIVGDEPINTAVIVQYLAYPVTVTVVDEDGMALANIAIGGTGLDSAPVTGKDGSVSFRLPAGTYTLTVTDGTNSAEKTLTVEDKAVSATITLKKEQEDEPAAAEGFNWAFDEATGKLTIWGSGPMPEWNVLGRPWFQVESKIKYIEIKKGITSISISAFSNCRNLISIDLPDGLTTIGRDAFSNCGSLISIDLPDGLTSIDSTTFEFCRSLSSIELPDGLTSIGRYAFRGCSSLRGIVLPDSLTSLGGYAFSQCTNLISIDLPDRLTSIGEYVFSQCTSLNSVDFPDRLASIGKCAFEDCRSLSSIDLPDGLAEIGNSAFNNCSSLSSIDLPDGVISIGDYAFYQCTSLSNIELSDSLTSIGSYAFSNCTSLSEVSFPAGLARLGEYAFKGCSSLSAIRFSGDAPPYISPNTYAFAGVIALAYYPASNPTWTETARLICGSGTTLTWIAY